MWFALWWMWVGHFVCDYPLQGDFLARAKNHRMPVANVPWLWALVAHSMIHAGWVYMVTDSFGLSLAELGAHIGIDYLKSNEDISFNTDQYLHLLCKVIWAIALV